jgi:hypothetical protein
VKVDGTLDKRDDEDKGWTVEMAIPLADVNGLDKAGAKVPPALGDSWRINLFRLDKPQKGGEIAVGWSPPLVGDFHALDKFGQIVFADDKGEVPQPAVAKGGPGGSAMKEALSGLKPGAAGTAAPGADVRIEGRKAPAGKAKKTAEGEAKKAK